MKTLIMYHQELGEVIINTQTSLEQCKVLFALPSNGWL